MGVAEFRSAASVLMDRFRFFKQAGVTFGGRRDLYDILGYQRQLTFEDYRSRYYRDGIAKRIVEAYPMATWRGGVELFEDEDPKKDTAFEKAWKELEQKFGIWQKLQAVDILAGLSTYAVLLIGAPGETLAEPLPKGKPSDLLYFQQFSGGGGPSGDNARNLSQAMNADCTIAEFDADAKSPRFGEPLFYQLKRTNLSSPMLQSKVHWTRVLHVAEGCLEDNVYGTPTLENVWNLLDDLAKVTGGGAEAFWLRANAGLHLDVDKTMQLAAAPAAATATSPAAMTQAQIDKLKDDAEDYANQMTRMLRTRGVTVTQLGSDVANFGQSADAILKQIGGSKGIPTRILTGSEMGTLASEQDAANFDSQVQDRRTGYAGPCIVRRLVDRLIEFNYLPTPEQYEIGWPVEENMDEAGKATFAVTLATVNKTQGAVIFTDDEIRDMAFDLEPLTPEQKVPLTAPERVSANAPTPAVDAQGKPIAAPADKNVPPGSQGGPKQRPEALPGGKLKAAEDAELLRILEEAIEADNEEVIASIIGITHRALGDVQGHEFHGNQFTDGQGLSAGHLEQRTNPLRKNAKFGDQVVALVDGKVISGHIARPGATPGTFGIKRADGTIVDVLKASLRMPKGGYKQRGAQAKLASTQIELPADVVETILALGRAIPDADLAADGREAEPHVTLKYGLTDPSKDTLIAAMTPLQTVTLTFGRTAYFEAADHDVVYVSVVGGNLDVLNKLVAEGCDCAPSDFGDYVPHATVAYVKSGLGSKYRLNDALDGTRVSANKVTLIAADGERTEVALA